MLPDVWDTPSLSSSLAEYSDARRQEQQRQRQRQQRQQATTTPTTGIPRAVEARAPVSLTPSGGGGDGDRAVQASVLFVQIFSAADFFSANRTLMTDPPPIEVDISLDPYLFNMIPHALLPVIGYIAIVVVVSFAVGRRSLAWLRVVASSPAQKEKKAQ